MKTDFLVIGSGLASLYFSINASKYGKCVIITKDKVSESNTKYAQGGIAAVFDKKDSFKSHIDDTIKAGAGLCNKKNVEIMVKSAPAEIKKLLSCGIIFDKYKGCFELGKEGAHSNRRILHFKDKTGSEIENKLVMYIKKNKNILIREYTVLVKLLVKKRKCYGAIVLDTNKNLLKIIIANCTILATGGIGQVYKYTTNPKVATGDGIASALEAGAKIENMEFVQFHPTALNVKSNIKFLMSEALRGEGAIIINSKEEKFIKHELKELAPRDVLAREIFDEIKKGKVYLDISHKKSGFIKKRFPTIYTECLRHRIDITKDKIPIAPAAHFLCGGIKTDSYGQTLIKNLFAVGECAYTGVHGANRLASNSLLECLVFSARAANKTKEIVNNKKIKNHFKNFYLNKHFTIVELNNNKIKEIELTQNKVRKIMWNNVGIIRTRNSLKLALKRIDEIEEKFKNNFKNKINIKIIETKNMITVAKLIIEASLKRKKSIGAFYLKE